MASQHDTVRLVDQRGVTVSVDASKAETRLATGYKLADGESAPAASTSGNTGSSTGSATSTAGNSSAQYDPGEYKVDEVVAYLADADEAERARVLEAEAAGKNRAGVTGWTPSA